jgi:hypothetical protein
MSAELLKSLCKFLDPHLSLLILEDFEEKKLVDQRTLVREKISVLSRTHLYDLTIDELKAAKNAENSAEIDKLIESNEDIGIVIF